MDRRNRMESEDSNGSVPNPDPTKRTVEQLQREIATSREIVESRANGSWNVLETRLSGMDKAIELIQKTSDTIPQSIKDQVSNLQSLHAERFDSVNQNMDIRFQGISIQFSERDKRTEQLSVADNKAIAAALQAQKESAGATTEMVVAAINKMEANFTKLIEQTQNLTVTGHRVLDEKINDVKGRIDRGEGRGSVSDPATAQSLQDLTIGLHKALVSGGVDQGRGVGQRELIAWLFAAGAIVATVVSRHI